MKAIDKAMMLAMSKTKSIKKEAATSFRIRVGSKKLEVRKVAGNEVEVSIREDDGGTAVMYVPQKLFNDSLGSYLQGQSN